MAERLQITEAARKPKNRKLRRRLWIVAGALELAAAGVGGGLDWHADHNIPEARQKASDHRDANKLGANVTDALTAGTTGDENIGGEDYRGPTSDIDTSNAVQIAGEQEQKLKDAKAIAAAKAVAKVREQIAADAHVRGNNFNLQKAQLAEIAKNQIVPEAQRYEARVRDLQDQKRRGKNIFLGTNAVLATLAAIPFSWRWNQKRIARNEERDRAWEKAQTDNGPDEAQEAVIDTKLATPKG